MKKTYIQPQCEYTRMLPTVTLLGVSNINNEYAEPGQL
jgi:hypothetical protein